MKSQSDYSTFIVRYQRLGVWGPINEKVRNLVRGFVSNLQKNFDFSANFFQLLITFLSLLCIPASERLV